jgi:3-methyl-2-oxobutanoate hydroxymethyltransferase
MIYHASSVVKAAKRSLIVVDIPFGSYQGNSQEALRSAIQNYERVRCSFCEDGGGDQKSVNQSKGC